MHTHTLTHIHTHTHTHTTYHTRINTHIHTRATRIVLSQLTQNSVRSGASGGYSNNPWKYFTGQAARPYLPEGKEPEEKKFKVHPHTHAQTHHTEKLNIYQ